MHVLLIGGNGFIGSHLKDFLPLNGVSVSVLDRFPERYRLSQNNVQVFLGDHTDLALTQRSMEGADALIYLASTSVPLTSASDPATDITTNLVPFLCYLDEALRLKVKRVVFLSSGGTVYGIPISLPVTEEHPTQPLVSHGIVKLMMEKYLFALAYNHGMEVVILRVGNAYGEGQNPFGRFGAIATFLGCFARRLPITIWGNGEMIRDYVYVKDIASACLAALNVKSSYSIYNIGTTRGYSLNDLIEIIANVTNLSAPDIHREERHSYDVPHIVLDSTLARQQLGWEPTTLLSGGLRVTWEWVQALSF